MSPATIVTPHELLERAHAFVRIGRALQEPEIANEEDLARAHVNLAKAQESRASAAAKVVATCTTTSASLTR